ncbi:hypothetical protein NE236_04290 [Actinoallomurus purpureus]|uniref:hypothetical protein n=1 Tax=Actinoallomurus purpureus TaxID=478114 RepID=UPI002093B054|nr:hypothetical protein [Actinoallomurus purpureus]MCO6004190.1 hypothetical protein [Actinoallomurus purpureus]
MTHALEHLPRSVAVAEPLTARQGLEISNNRSTVSSAGRSSDFSARSAGDQR